MLKAQTQEGVFHLQSNICPPLSLLHLSGSALLLYYVRLMLRTKWKSDRKCHCFMFSLLSLSNCASLSLSLPKESVCDLRPITEIGGEPFFCQVGVWRQAGYINVLPLWYRSMSKQRDSSLIIILLPYKAGNPFNIFIFIYFCQLILIAVLRTILNYFHHQS